MNGAPLVELKNASVRIEEHAVVTGVDLTIGPGEFVYLIGKTGSGKSSLLKALYGERALSSGSGKVCGTDLNTVHRRNVHELRRSLGIVFQDFALLPDRTVEDNLLFVLKATGWIDHGAMNERTKDCLVAVGLGLKGYKHPHELSGGEQQRVAIARALLNEPPLILADEPTGNLDPDTTEEILDLLHGLVSSGSDGPAKRSVIMATHNHGAVARRPGRVLRVENGRVIDSISV
jgi:cell division transport system ATP-binding protein